MSDTAYKGGAFEQPDDDDSVDQDFLGGQPGHDEFISEIGQTLELPELDVDGYVGPDGRPQPHQSPAEVAEARDEALDLDRHAREAGRQEASAGDVQDIYDPGI